ncbi:hypothetical protein K504DRAFT_538511 [Pleomassaria siparia CBS 279.74]|uniref:Uncharacterized protein n=1 Tax=Pleomassaria siparia CBS 279.74 TaxID=1314801 RepID=A0A6G1JUX7_9PLEO|nr:hypothetical protein K504DRAFT_538511 [Pleomassaria siparia CBS 279.74]
MASWSREAIIALVALFATCFPIFILLWGLVIRRRRHRPSPNRPHNDLPMMSFTQSHRNNSNTHWVYLVRRESEFCAAFAVDAAANSAS